MQGISIVTHRYPQKVREKIIGQITILDQNGIKVEFSEDIEGSYNTFLLKTIDNPLSHYTFVYYIANMLAEFIIEDLEDVLLKRIVEENCTTFLAEEKDIIWQNASQSVKDLERNVETSKQRKKIVFQRILDYLEDNCVFSIEGFLRFRLRDYYNQLEENVTKGVENFVMEKEYREFIRLLRYFVEMQEPRMEEVHVFWKNKNFQIVDSNGKKINNDLLEDFALDLFDEGINQGDLLVSTLITISPLTIVLHSKEQKEIVDTVKSIFTSRVIICKGCPFCNSEESEKPSNWSEVVGSGGSSTGGKDGK